MKKILLMLVTLVLVLGPLSSCGSSSNDSGGSSGGNGATSASFTASSPTPPPNSLTMQAATSNGVSFTIDVVATDVTDLYGATYTLTYSPAILKFIGASEGTHLSTGGISTFFQVALENGVEGRLVVGHSRVGNATGVSGSGTLHSLSFQAVAKGTTGMAFESAELRDASNGAIPGVFFSGGSGSGQ